MPVLSAEVQLLGWAKSTSKSGPKVVLLLQSDDEIAFFESLTLAKGKTAGQILDVIFKLSQQDDQSQVSAEALESFKQSDDYRVAVASGIFQDKEEPADDPFIGANREALNHLDAQMGIAVELGFQSRESSKTATGLRCREAVGLMKEKDFTEYWKWLGDKDVLSAHSANIKDFVQMKCGIKSRREFDEGPDADKKYAKFCAIKTAYRKWQKQK